MKKILSVISYLLFVICYFAILSGCMNPLNPLSGSSGKEQLAPGMGYLTLSVAADDSGRTILPDNEWMGGVKKLVFAFYNIDETTPAFEPKVYNYAEFTGGTTGKTIQLPAGSYDLDVVAYSDTEMTNAVARGSNSEYIVITTGGSSNVTIKLSAIIDKDQGTFSWNITLENLELPLTAATMTITPRSSGVAGSPMDLSPVNLLNADPPLDLTGSIPLDAGYYNVVFKFVRGDKTISLRKILHVYSNLESVLEGLAITEDHFGKTILTMDVEGPITLTPIDPVTLNVYISGFENMTDATGAKLSVTLPLGLVMDSPSPIDGTFDPATGIKTFSFTVKFGVDAPLTSGSLEIPIEPQDLPGPASGYIQYNCESRSLPLGITAGETESNAIPVNKGNILRFNEYANTTAGLTRHYKLAEDVELSAPVVSTSNWTAIGPGAFTGTFNGGGHTISGLTINATANFQGMFGYITGDGENTGIVKNLGLVNVSISGAYSVGGVVGQNEGTVENCYVTGTVSGTGSSVGGVVGYNYKEPGTAAIVRNCYATSNVSGSSSNIGGIVGDNSEGAVENCYATGTVSGNDNVGGVVGLNNSGTVKNCVAFNPSITATVTGASPSIGRVAGSGLVSELSKNYAQSYMLVNNSIINGTSERTVHGENITPTEWNDAGWWKNSGKWDTSTWDENTWLIQTNNLPILKNAGGSQNPEVKYAPGSPVDPFLVRNDGDNINELPYVGRGSSNPPLYKNWTLSAYYKLMDDVDLSGGTWEPIGADTTPFTGCFDGQGHTISGLTTTNATADFQGMFGIIDTSGKVINLGLVDCDITGASQVGGIAGKNDGTVSNCYVTGKVSGTDNTVGGVVGLNNYGTVENCYATGSVSGINNVGGVVGINESMVQNCYATGDVSGNDNAGGVAGDNYGTVQNCVALNPSVTATGASPSIGRVAGSGTSGLSKNYARSDMLVNDEPATATGNTTPNGGDVGAGEVSGQYNNQDFWSSSLSLSWDFNEATGPWAWNTAAKLPILRGFTAGTQNPTAPPIPIIHTAWYTVNPDAPLFTISTAAQLAGLAQLVNGKFNATTGLWDEPQIDFNGKTINLDSDIDLSNYGILNPDFNDGKGWIPIGITGNDIISYFAGSFDGGGNTISGLYIKDDDDELKCHGLFGAINATAKVEKLGLIAVDIISAGSNVGGIVGVTLGEVENCFVTGKVSGGDSVGGLVGCNDGTVKNCYATADVTGTGFGHSVGGVVGYNNDTGSIEYCYATGAVSGANQIGGVAGDNYGTVQNCVALNPSVTATLTPTPSIGRVAGSDSMGTLSGNKARDDMLVNGEIPTTDIGPSAVNGADVAVGISLSGVFNTGDWSNPSIWDIQGGMLDIGCNLPTLFAVPQSPAPTLPSLGSP